MIKPSPYSFATLKQTALRNPIVAAFVKEWEVGGFCTLEGALLGLACHLAEENERLKMKAPCHCVRCRNIVPVTPCLNEIPLKKNAGPPGTFGEPIMATDCWTPANAKPSTIATLRATVDKLREQSSPLTSFTASSPEAAEAFIAKHGVPADVAEVVLSDCPLVTEVTIEPAAKPMEFCTQCGTFFTLPCPRCGTLMGDTSSGDINPQVVEASP